MLRSAFWNHLFLSLHRHRSRHLAVLVMAFLIVSLLTSVLFLAEALRRDTLQTLSEQADLVVQRVRGGRAVDLPAMWAEDFATIPGVGAAVPRLHGRYFHEPSSTWFTVVGLDPFDPRAGEAFAGLFEGLDLRSFLAEPSMIVGSGVADFLAANHYDTTYDFVTPDAERLEVRIVGTFPADSGLFTSDLVLMDIDLARRVLGVAPGAATDIALSVPNPLEYDAVMAKLIGRQYDIRVLQKTELETAFENMLNFKGGVFLLMYLTVAATFALILYQRYSLMTGAERRQIGILRAVGWSMGDVIRLKLAESLVVALSAFAAGLLFSYLYVFYARAPGLSAVFVGAGNLPVDFRLARHLDSGLLAALFLLFMVPFAAAVLVPVWRAAATEPVEAMK